MSKLVYERMAELSKRNTEEELKLKAETVELSVAGDVKKVSSSLKSGIKKVEASNKALEKATTAKQKAADAAEKAEDAGIKAWQDAGDIRNDAVDVLNKAETAAKELGVDPNEIAGFKEAMDSFNKIDSLSDENKGLRNELNEI